MTNKIVWHGSFAEWLRLRDALAQNGAGHMSCPNAACTEHLDQRTLDGLLFMRKYAGRLYTQEYITERDAA